MKINNLLSVVFILILSDLALAYGNSSSQASGAKSIQRGPASADKAPMCVNRTPPSEHPPELSRIQMQGCRAPEMMTEQEIMDPVSLAAYASRHQLNLKDTVCFIATR